MAASVEQFSSLVSRIYGAALDGGLWESTLTALLDALGGHGGALLLAESGSRRFRSTAIGMDGAGVMAYESHYGRMDPVPSMLIAARVGNVFSGSHLATPGEHRRTEFYTDWAKPFGTGDGLFASLTKSDGGLNWFCCNAPLRDEPFATPERMRLLQLLVPHLQQALAAQHRLADAANVTHRALDAYEHMRHGVAWVSPGGKLMHGNSAALDLFRSGSGLSLAADGQLRAGGDEVNASLRRLIGLAASGDGDGIKSAGFLSVRRSHGGSPLAVHVLPVSAEAHCMDGHVPGALLIVVDVDERGESRPEILQDLFGLTRSEAMVATAMLSHGSLEAIAVELGVSLATVRTHLHRVYSKVGVNRQSDLVRVVQTVHADLRQRPHNGFPS
ncbi:helix-turn-helix transcriptional regulator [Mesorhizobium sp. CAU 1732]|uniref:helix-turn-helix transcriptional regulator n=1 Tax=Mesorhizobium sp. CAU 1732 TaxID=3140358 RepID=UPI003261B26B